MFHFHPHSHISYSYYLNTSLLTTYMKYDDERHSET